MISFSYSVSQVLGYSFVPKSPIITAFILLLTSRRFHRDAKTAGPVPRNRKRVFFLPKTLFREDLVNVFSADDPEFDLWYVSRQPLAKLADWYLLRNFSEYDYRSTNDDDARQKQALRAHWEAALRIFAKLARPSAFLTCAYYYRDQREFAAASVANGIPFVALHKECITTPIARAAREEIYGKFSGPFTGTCITTYNEEEKATMVAAGVAPAGIIDVVGCPRMDPLFRRTSGSTEATGAFDIVFFSFSKTTYLPVYRRVPKWPESIDRVKIEPWNWSQLYLRFHQFAIDFARAHPHLRIALKVKTGFNILDILEQERQREQPLPSNLQVINMGEGGTLATAAKVVCGFNSTVLLEAIASRTPVVIPTFAEAKRGSTAEKYGTLRLGKAVQYAASEMELVRLLESQSRQPPQRDREYTDDERLALERYVGFADGKSGERMRSSIAKAIRA